MKEFGLYTIKKNYIDEFSKIDTGLEFLKNNRPFICIKVTVAKRNWLIPIASINPAAPDYIDKVTKYKDFAKLDKEQANRDGNQFARAIHIVKDLTGLQPNPDFKSVIEYYNALPVKHKYCKKYRDANRNHIIISDTKLKEVIKKTLVVNIKAKMQGQQIGYIKAKIANGHTNFANFPKKSIEIGEVLYKDHIALQAAEKERARRSEEQKQFEAHKKELKNQARSKIIVEIEPLRIFGRTGNGDVFTKIPGKNPEDIKTKIALPKADILIDKDGQHIIGVSAELQQRYNFKLPGGQPKRIRK